MTRYKEKIEIVEDDLFYSYIDIKHSLKKKVIEINRNDIEKITYLENCNKITLYGNIYTKGELDNKDKEQKIDSFVMYGYFVPDILRWFEDVGMKIEYLFCLNSDGKKSM